MLLEISVDEVLEPKAMYVSRQIYNNFRRKNIEAGIKHPEMHMTQSEEDEKCKVFTIKVEADEKLLKKMRFSIYFCNYILDLNQKKLVPDRENSPRDDFEDLSYIGIKVI